MKFKPGDTIIVGALKAPKFNYVHIVGKQAVVHSYQGGWAPYYRVIVDGEERVLGNTWCIQEEDALTLYIEENTQAIGMLEGGDPYE